LAGTLKQDDFDLLGLHPEMDLGISAVVQVHRVPRTASRTTWALSVSCISKIGNACLRRAMYMSAVTVSRLYNSLGAYDRCLLEQGKPKKVALIALARKLLRICFAVLKTAQPFDPA